LICSVEHIGKLAVLQQLTILSKQNPHAISKTQELSIPLMRWFSIMRKTGPMQATK
jgi:hypothetical protein